MIYVPEKEANEEIILEFVTQLNLVSHEKLGAGGTLRSKFGAGNLFGAKSSHTSSWIGEIN